MSIRILCSLFATILFCSTQLRAQERVPIGALPTYYNGGFAGEAGVPRINAFTHLSYSIDRGYGGTIGPTNSGIVISADHFVKKIRSGVAFTAGLDNFGGTSKGPLFSVAVSPKFSFKGKYTFAPFADLTYHRHHVRLSYYPASVPSPSNFPRDFIVQNFGIRTGFLVNSARAYAGLTADVANYATDVLKMTERWRAFENVRYTLQAGYTFQRTPDSKFSFTPQLALSLSRYSQYDSSKMERLRKNIITLMDLNLMFRYSKFIAGINSVGFVVGYQTEKFRIQFTNFYSRRAREGKGIDLSDHTRFNSKPNYDFPNTYNGNISVRYIFRKKESVKMPGF
jgi:hypothetical protein